MKRVLVLSDFSPQARNAIRFAGQHLSHSMESLVILNAIFSTANTRNTLIHLDDILREKSERGLALDKSFAKEVLGNPHVEVKTIGMPVRFDYAIRDVIRQEEVDLLLLAPLEALNQGNKTGMKLDSYEWAQTFGMPVLALPA